LPRRHLLSSSLPTTAWLHRRVTSLPYLVARSNQSGGRCPPAPLPSPGGRRDVQQSCPSLLALEGCRSLEAVKGTRSAPRLRLALDCLQGAPESRISHDRLRSRSLPAPRPHRVPKAYTRQRARAPRPAAGLPGESCQGRVAASACERTLDCWSVAIRCEAGGMASHPSCHAASVGVRGQSPCITSVRGYREHGLLPTI
jgi:hypothetical protein